MKKFLLFFKKKLKSIICRVKIFHIFIYRFLSKFSKNNKVALCCIAKCENEYINEFIEYYKKIGVDKIFIYDNNDIDGENLTSKLWSEINSNFCEVIDYRGKKKCQLEAYDNCYLKHKKDYKWFLFFDCDEFLTFTQHQNIKDYLSQKYFDKYQVIHINWMVFGDNDLLYNDGRHLVERFKNPILPFNFQKNNFPENNHIKSIIRGNLKNINWTNTPHTPYDNSQFNLCCNSIGIECDINSPFNPFDFSVAYIRHYCTKTIDEWVRIKQKRGFPDQYDYEIGKKLDVEEFFKINKWTEDKQLIINKYSNNL